MLKACADCDPLKGHVCKACRTQEDEIRKERNKALGYRPSFKELTESAQALIARGSLPGMHAGLPGGLRCAMAAKNPARREVFRLLGIYLPEPQARMLLHEVHDYMWIQAEKAGCDIWQVLDNKQPFAAAAREWGRRYLASFTTYWQRRLALAAI